MRYRSFTILVLSCHFFLSACSSIVQDRIPSLDVAFQPTSEIIPYSAPESYGIDRGGRYNSGDLNRLINADKNFVFYSDHFVLFEANYRRFVEKHLLVGGEVRDGEELFCVLGAASASEALAERINLNRSVEVFSDHYTHLIHESEDLDGVRKILGDLRSRYPEKPRAFLNGFDSYMIDVNMSCSDHLLIEELRLLDRVIPRKTFHVEVNRLHEVYDRWPLN